MNHKEFEMPVATVIVFGNEEVITASNFVEREEGDHGEGYRDA